MQLRNTRLKFGLLWKWAKSSGDHYESISGTCPGLFACWHFRHDVPSDLHDGEISGVWAYGAVNFKNEVIRRRTGLHGGPGKWGPVHDAVPFHTRSDDCTWNNEYQPCNPSCPEDNCRFVDEGTGRENLHVLLAGAGTRKGESGQPWRGVDSGDAIKISKAGISRTGFACLFPT